MRVAVVDEPDAAVSNVSLRRVRKRRAEVLDADDFVKEPQVGKVLVEGDELLKAAALPCQGSRGRVIEIVFLTSGIRYALQLTDSPGRAGKGRRGPLVVVQPPPPIDTVEAARHAPRPVVVPKKHPAAEAVDNPVDEVSGHDAIPRIGPNRAAPDDAVLSVLSELVVRGREVGYQLVLHRVRISLPHVVVRELPLGARYALEENLCVPITHVDHEVLGVANQGHTALLDVAAVEHGERCVGTDRRSALPVIGEHAELPLRGVVQRDEYDEPARGVGLGDLAQRLLRLDGQCG